MPVPADRDTALPVLVADDDEALRRVYVRALQRAGFTTLEARDGPEALQRIDEEEVGLVLLDIHMPGMDGVEIVERLRADERTRTLPVILITGTAEVADRVRGLQAGADDYVVKSTHLSELVARVRARVRVRAAWSDVVARELANRARVVAKLAAVTAAATPEETAAALVAGLAAETGVSFISFLIAEPDGGLAPLAGWKAGFGCWSGGPALARETSRYLVDRAAGGPWMETAAGVSVEHTGRYSPLEVGTACMAPLKQTDDLLGLLVVATAPGSGPVGPAGDLLAATIDYAAVGTAVLGPALVSRRQNASERHDVERVISEGAFGTVFQPIVRIADRRVVGYEALTRFADGMRPDLRFREAARLGLGLRLEEATLAEAIRTAAALPAGCPLGVNVTPTSLMLEPGWLVALAGRTGRRLVVELTEHAEISDYEELRRALASLPPEVDLAVDDAGAGYASLRHILELRPRYVKLDLALVRGIESDPMRQSLITGLYHCVEEMGGDTVAEGVETEAEAEALLRLGISFAQGYLFGRPAPVESWVSPS